MKITFPTFTIAGAAVIAIFTINACLITASDKEKKARIAELEKKADALTENSAQMTNLLHAMWVRGFNDGTCYMLKIIPFALDAKNQGVSNDVVSARVQLWIKERLSLGEFYTNNEFEHWSEVRTLK